MILLTIENAEIVAYFERKQVAVLRSAADTAALREKYPEEDVFGSSSLDFPEEYGMTLKQVNAILPDQGG